MAAQDQQWSRIVRYVSLTDDATRLGEPILPTSSADVDIFELARAGQLEVEVLEGADVFNVTRSSRKDKVKILLGPLEAKHVPIIRCIGLNYRSHILESNRPLPKSPTVFNKPGPAVADCGEDIPIPNSHRVSAITKES